MAATTETVATLPGASPLGHYADLVDQKTLDILERRRRTAVGKRRGWLVRRALAAADVVGLVAAFLVAQWLFGDGDKAIADRVDLKTETLLFVLTLPGWIVGAKIYGLYDRDEERTDHSTADDVVGVFHMLTVGSWLLFAGAWITGWADPQIQKLIAFWLLGVVAVPSARAAARAYCRRQPLYIQNTIVVGAGDVGQRIARKLLNHPEYGLNLVGFVDGNPKERRADIGHLTLLGGTERLSELVDLLDVERVIIAFSGESAERTVDLVRELQHVDVQIDVVPRLFELVAPGVGVHTIEGLSVLGLPPVKLARSSAFLKRAFDVAITLPALLVFVPFSLIIAILIKIDDPRGPVFFRQVRMGSKGVFRIWKFRTMWVDAEERKHEFAHLNKHLAPGGDARMFKITDDPRVTRVGRVLRRYSLDELPQLFNVLKGDMALVGPRPLILEEDGHVGGDHRLRLQLKPGCTGPWQVHGGSGIPFEEMVSLDYLYVASWSMWNDTRLLLRTIPLLVRGGGGSC